MTQDGTWDEGGGDGDPLAGVFPGNSEMARLMRRHDWSATPLGDPRAWPDALKIPMRMLLTTRFEMWLGWGPDMLFFYNDAYIPTLGIKHPAMMGRPFREVWAEVYDDVADQVARVWAGEGTWNKALLLLLERSGYPEETYHSFSYSPLHGGDGSVSGLLCVVNEDTERVIGERRMDTLRQLGMALVGAASEDTVRQAACTVLDANRRDFPFALVRLGASPLFHAAGEAARALVDRTEVAALLPPEAADDPAAAQVVRLPDGIDWPSGDWDRPPDAAMTVPIPGAADQAPFGWLILGLNPYRRADDHLGDFVRLIAGQISGALANVAALTAAERRAERIWSHGRDLMVVVGADGVFRSASPAWTRILGHPAEDVVGHHFSEFIVPEDEPDSLAALQRAAAAADLTGFENRYRTADGAYRWISWHTAVEDGLVYAYGRDVTDQRANAEALRAAEEALRQAQKMDAVGQLTGGIAHDFNNLLTGIIGSLEMMQRRIAQGRTADVERYAAAATASADRAASLTQRLLAFSRRQALDPKVVDVNQLVAGMDELIRRSIGEGIVLEQVCAADLWHTRCDANQLESAILNLAINARDAMPGGGRLTIATTNATIDPEQALLRHGGPPGEYVTVCVADTGHGMAPDVAARAFEPFFTTKPLGQGTGLGLSMIYGFARQSGGFVTIDSAEGTGTAVRLHLPRCHDSAVVEPPVEASPQAARPPPTETVLVVEDEPTVRALIVDALQERGYRTIEAGDGPAGLEILRSAVGVDLLVSDVGLPGLNGRQLADAGRALRPDLPVLFVTGYAHNAAVGNGLLEPGMEVLTKPFAIDQLMDRIRAMIDGRPARLGDAVGPAVA
ncbi:PAS domain-containing protein [Zavarzinia sp. CC-PAN008]|uniref:PAS domain-containing protein n=1 Tax=Zavarzinia sp. CC-PAN008 TaxID=3243332 RepID=UPI003F745BDC